MRQPAGFKQLTARQLQDTVLTSQPMKAMDSVLLVVGLLVTVALLLGGCFVSPREIPKQYCGEYAFDKQASIAYWEDQSAWPQATKDLLIKMALPTTLTIEANRVIVTDTATGKTSVQKTRVRQIGSNFIKLELHSNFAKTNKITTFQFDADGFWLIEGTLFPNYRERFKSIQKI